MSRAATRFSKQIADASKEKPRHFTESKSIAENMISKLSLLDELAVAAPHDKEGETVEINTNFKLAAGTWIYMREERANGTQEWRFITDGSFAIAFNNSGSVHIVFPTSDSGLSQSISDDFEPDFVASTVSTEEFDMHGIQSSRFVENYFVEDYGWFTRVGAPLSTLSDSAREELELFIDAGIEKFSQE